MSLPSPAPPGDSATVSILVTATREDAFDVTVRHRGWSALPSGHPVRHSLVGPEFRMIGLWWGELRTSFREPVADHGGPPAS